jgi:hypothetical protein
MNEKSDCSLEAQLPFIFPAGFDCYRDLSPGEGREEAFNIIAFIGIN